MKKQIIALAMAGLVAAGALAGCAAAPAAPAAAPAPAASEAPAAEAPAAEAAAAPAAEAPAEDYKPLAGETVNVAVCSGAGGSTDNGLRLMLPYLEELTGATFTVTNESGGGGFICWLAHANDAPDGLSWIMVNDTMDFAGLNPQAPQTLNSRDFQLLGCQVVDISALSCRANEDRWTDLQSLIDYAKENEVTVSVSSLGSEDANVIYLMNNKLGTKFNLVVASEGSSGAVADVIGGHVDVYSNNVASTAKNLSDDGLRAICVFNSERSQLWPDVPTFEEVTGLAISSHSARGLMMPKGGDQQLVDYIVDVVAQATQNPEYVKQMADMYLEVVYLNPDEFQSLFDNSKADVESILEDIGWK